MEYSLWQGARRIIELVSRRLLYFKLGNPAPAHRNMKIVISLPPLHSSHLFSNLFLFPCLNLLFYEPSIYIFTAILKIVTAVL
jgi:hypothetical protein